MRSGSASRLSLSIRRSFSLRKPIPPHQPQEQHHEHPIAKLHAATLAWSSVVITSLFTKPLLTCIYIIGRRGEGCWRNQPVLALVNGLVNSLTPRHRVEKPLFWFPTYASGGWVKNSYVWHSGTAGSANHSSSAENWTRELRR